MKTKFSRYLLTVSLCYQARRQTWGSEEVRAREDSNGKKVTTAGRSIRCRIRLIRSNCPISLKTLRSKHSYTPRLTKTNNLNWAGLKTSKQVISKHWHTQRHWHDLTSKLRDRTSHPSIEIIILINYRCRGEIFAHCRNLAEKTVKTVFLERDTSRPCNV